MYYDEMQNGQGEWFWRGTPDGEWTKFSYEKLQTKLNDLAGRLANAYAAITQPSDSEPGGRS